MKSALLLLVVVVALSVVGCSSPDAYGVSPSQETTAQDEDSLDDTFVQEAEEQLISDEPFIELGEMI
jgi:hypothetical protein